MSLTGIEVFVQGIGGREEVAKFVAVVKRRIGRAQGRRCAHRSKLKWFDRIGSSELFVLLFVLYGKRVLNEAIAFAPHHRLESA